jgi:hypothetical protein
MQRKIHSYEGFVERLTFLLRSRPRQYTERFKLWGMSKNTRRNAERKPRSGPSIYRSTIAREDSHNSTTVSIDRSQVVGSTDPEFRAGMNATWNKQTVWTSPTERPSAMSDMNCVDQHRPRGSESATNSLKPDGATASSAIVIDDDQEELENPTCSTPRRNVSSEARSSALQNPTLATLWGLHQHPTYGQQSLLSTVAEQLAEQASSDLGHLLDIEVELQNTKRKLEEQNILTLGIWQLWQAKNTHLFSSYVDETPFFTALPISKAISLRLEKWLAFYPRTIKFEGQSHSRLPAFPTSDTPILTWMLFAERGYAIASRKTRMTPIQAQARVRLSVCQLTASMILAPDGSRYLRRCFEIILTCLQTILKHQHSDLEQPCQRIAEKFPLRLSESEELRITGNSMQDKEAAALAMICHDQVTSQEIDSSRAFQDLGKLFTAGARFSVERAFVWATRFMLYYASPELDMSSLPADLCARALDGCGRILGTIRSHPHQNSQSPKEGSDCRPLSDVWQDSNFASLWAEWVCSDSGFFLHDSLK